MSISVTISLNNDNNALDTKITRQKGKSLLDMPSDYTIIDLETTGLDPSYDEIIEVACIKYKNNEEVARFQSLVKPTQEYDEGVWIDDFISSFTGITNDMIKTAPLFSEISNTIWDFLKDEVLIGHNVNFDVNFLYDNFYENQGLILSNNFVDTLRLARKALPELKHHRLDDLTAYFKIDIPHHRALNDCLITKEIFNSLSNIIKEKHIDLTSYRYHGKSKNLLEIKGNAETFDTEHIFYDKNCVFTGKLERFTREEAAQMVANIGGHCQNNINKKTNFLIVGCFDYVSNVKGNKSTKIKKAENLILQNQDLKIITENVFYDLLHFN